VLPSDAITRPGIRTPRAAAVAGIVFAVLLSTSLVLFRLAIPSAQVEVGNWIASPSRRRSVGIALGLVPFAGIAFLWFIGVVRDRIGDAEDRFFATVFLGSGLLFVAMFFVSSAILGGIIAAAPRPGLSLDPSVVAFSTRLTHLLSTVYGLRMAAVFVAVTSTVLLRERVAPRWIAFLGYAVALMLLLAIGISVWVELAFPIWVFVLSVHILLASFRRDEQPDPGSPNHD
jgi:hypothetical protein